MYSVCSVSNPSLPTDGNPRADRFEVLKRYERGQAVALLVRYPDAKNYGGDKILVYWDLKKLDVAVKLKDLDPHFLETRYSPIARFVPTDSGWDMAIHLVDSIGR